MIGQGRYVRKRFIILKEIFIRRHRYIGAVRESHVLEFRYQVILNLVICHVFEVWRRPGTIWLVRCVRIETAI